MVDAVGTTHSVKIGSDFFLIRPGTYRKQAAPMQGARFTTGDPDYNTLNIWQYWAQRCWVGGFGAETWMDDAMYDEGAGVDTTQHEVMVLTRDLVQSGGAIALNSDVNERRFVIFNDTLYVLAFGAGALASKLWRHDGSGVWTLVHTFNDPCRSLCVFNGKLFVGDEGDDLIYMDENEDFTAVDKPAGVGDTIPYAMKVYRSHLYVAFGRQIWRLTGDLEWDGATAFYVADGVNRITNMEVHLGFLYMVSANGHVLRTDANNTFDLWSFPENVVITSIRSFDGKLFISCNEPLDGTTAQQAVIYQLSGAAVTELKRWGKVGRDLTTGQMRVIGSRLYFGAGGLFGFSDDGFGIGVYDPREDAYHMFATNRDDATYPGGSEGLFWRVDDVIFHEGTVWCSVRNYGIFRTALTYKDVTRFQATYDTTPAGSTPDPLNGGWITSSDFDAGTPGLLKYWDAIIVDVDLPTDDCTVYVEVSGNGGQGWAEVGLIEKSDATKTRYSVAFPLEEISGTPLARTHLKWRLTLRTTDTTRCPQVRGVTVRYLPIPEPNWMWHFNVVLSERQELLDDTVRDDIDIDTLLSNLETAFRSQVPIHFTDIDGTEWGASGAKQVLVRDMVQDVRVVGHEDEGPIEREIRLTLLEVKDQYEVLG